MTGNSGMSGFRETLIDRENESNFINNGYARQR